MLEAAVEGAGGRVNVLGVTVLTSVSSDDVAEAGYRHEFSTDIRQLVMKRAGMARDAGCAGIVCSGREVQAVRAAFGHTFQTVTPGIRPHGGAVAEEDQSRIVTPVMAIRKGADYLVIGRPIRDAADPRTAVRAIVKEIRTVLDDGA
jgi:orotidine-5'-phosphate decarboxylase